MAGNEEFALVMARIGARAYPPFSHATKKEVLLPGNQLPAK